MRVVVTGAGLAFMLGSSAVAAAEEPKAPPAAPRKADTEEPEWKVSARRQTLYDEGRKLSGQEEWAKALDKFHEVHQLRPHPRVLVWMAHCEEHLGNLQKALAIYRQAEAQAREAKWEDVVKEAVQMAADLASKVPHLVLRVSPDVDMDVLIDDQKSTPRDGHVDVDPGEHTVVLRAVGWKGYQAKVNVALAEEKILNVSLEEAPLPIVLLPQPPHYRGPASGSIALLAVASGFMISGAVTTAAGFSSDSKDLRGAGLGLLIGGALGVAASVPWAVISARATPIATPRYAFVSATPLRGGASLGVHATF